MQEPQVNLFKDLDHLTAAAALDFSETVTESVHEKGFALVALSGGTTPQPLFELLARAPYRDSIPWSNIHFFWADERCVPSNDPQSNYGQVKRTLLKHVPVTPGWVHPVNGNLAPKEAARVYAAELAIFIEDEQDWPLFDFVLLGMGSDGHTASLFPGQDNPDEGNSTVIAVTAHYQDRPANRVSMTPAVFNNAARVVFLVSGEAKADALNKVLNGPYDPLNLPAQRVLPWHGSLSWFVNSAAAAALPDIKK